MPILAMCEVSLEEAKTLRVNTVESAEVASTEAVQKSWVSPGKLVILLSKTMKMGIFSSKKIY